MIKVVNVISDTNVGGAGKCLINFCKNFNKEKFEITVVLPKGSELVKHLEGTSVKLVEIDGLKDKSLDVKSIYPLIKILKSEQPDVVHTHSSLTARIAAKFVKDCKIVFTRHSIFPLTAWQKSLPSKWITKTTNEIFSDKIIAVAEAAKENLIESGSNPEKIDVVLNGVEKIEATTLDEKKTLKEKLKIKDDEHVIGIVARLEKVKGHDTFLEAAKKIIDEEKIKAKFLILGTGSEENNLKSKAKELGIEKNVIFTGFINNVKDYLNIFDVQVNCSYGTEATSLALLEGMSLGIPAVVTDYGGNPGVITNGENGYIVPIKSPKDTADLIVRILTNEDLKKYMNRRSIELYEEKFTIQKYTENIERIYEEMSSEPQIKRLNMLDVFIILLVIIACIFGYKYVNSSDAPVIQKNTTKVTYQIRTSESLQSMYDMISENTSIYDSTKNLFLGTIVKKEILDSERYEVDYENSTFTKSALPRGTAIDVLLTIEADANISEQNISVGDYVIKVGAPAYIKGKGYAGKGYITSIERNEI